MKTKRDAKNNITAHTDMQWRYRHRYSQYWPMFETMNVGKKFQFSCQIQFHVIHLPSPATMERLTAHTANQRAFEEADRKVDKKQQFSI